MKVSDIIIAPISVDGDPMTETRISGIGNYYGGLSVKQEGNKYYWSILDYDGENWKEIPQYLYDTLLRHEAEQIQQDLVE